RDLIDGNLSCAAAMMYNEYWSLLRAGLKPGDLLLTRLADEGLGFLEDGLYVRQGSLADPARRDALTRFLRATLGGWASARRNVEEALAVSLERRPGADAGGQRFMLETILPLVGDESRIGLLDIGAYDRSLAIIDGQGDSAAGRGGWTHTLW